MQKNKLFDTVFDKPQYNPDIKYRFSTYVVQVDHKNKHLLFNTLNRQLIALDNDEFNTLSCETASELNCTLVADGFLVPTEADDYNTLSEVRRIVQMFNSFNYKNSFVILPTTDCNARCFYCFEHGTKKKYMSEQTAYDVGNYIIEQSNKKPIKIQWFGGEPLCNTEAINIISKKLVENGQKFKSTMISNGYLFSNDIIVNAKEIWNLDFVQITLDGTEKIYNKTKSYIYKSDSNPFLTVLSNINNLLKNNIKVSIRINIDRHNKNDLYNLIDLLCEEFSDYKDILGVYVFPLYESRKSHQNEITLFEHNELLKEQIKLEEYIESNNLHLKALPKSNVRLNSCWADSDFAAIIMPDGNLGKCDHHLDNDFFGNIYSSEEDQKIIDYWKQYRADVELCNACPLRPQCMKLKNCPENSKFICNEFEQKRALNKIIRQIKNAYDYC